ncbi:hypothetical protein N9B82_01140 [Saprospiraceae bacterium]|nr:hypothetical protein [Saprospiraceae bacterium]
MKNALVFLVLILSIFSCKNEWQVIEFTHLDNELTESFLPSEYFTSNFIFYSTLDSLHAIELEESVSFQSKNKFNYTADKFVITVFQRPWLIRVSSFVIQSEVFYETPTSVTQQLKFNKNGSGAVGNSTDVVIEITESGFTPGEFTEFREVMTIDGILYNDVYFSPNALESVFVNQELGVFAYEEEGDTINLLGF